MPKDLDALSNRIALIADIRILQECNDQPDPAIPGVEYPSTCILAKSKFYLTW